MRILDWNILNKTARRAALARPQVQVRAEFSRVASELIKRVRTEGDVALKALTEHFDGADIATLAVTRNEFAAARRALSSKQLAALERAIANVQRCHEPQAPTPLIIEIEAGVRCEQLIRPISSVGLYVPGGTAPLP